MSNNDYSPPVSVLMPVYNAEHTVAETISSVLRQSFQDFEFVIVDDGSQDNTLDIVAGFQDTRIKIHSASNNTGIANTLNRGVMLCEGKYICRIDADDLFHKNKIRIQYNFMEKNKGCIISSTHYRKVKNNTISKASSRHFFSVTDDKIRVEMLRNSPLCHPSVMLRKSLFTEKGLLYSEEADHCEDYELWYQARSYGPFHIINRPLLYYRIHPDQVSNKHAMAQCRAANKIREKLIKELHPDITAEELKIHLALMTDLNSREGIDLQAVSAWVEKICAINKQRRLYNIRYFNKLLKHREKRFYRDDK